MTNRRRYAEKEGVGSEEGKDRSISLTRQIFTAIDFQTAAGFYIYYLIVKLFLMVSSMIFGVAQILCFKKNQQPNQFI